MHRTLPALTLRVSVGWAACLPMRFLRRIFDPSVLGLRHRASRSAGSRRQASVFCLPRFAIGYAGGELSSDF